jgi:hypothetical protein
MHSCAHKINLRHSVPPAQAGGAFCRIFLLFLPLTGRATVLTQETIYVKNVQTVLLICTDASGQNMRSAYLVSMGSPLGILPLPGATRVQQTQTDAQGRRVQLYAPLSEAYRLGGEDPAQAFTESVRFLLSGTPIDRTVAFTVDDVSRLAAALGGVQISIVDLPEIAVHAVGGQSIYPFDTSNDPMAILIRQQIDLGGLTADYDLDTARALRRAGAAVPETLTLSGEAAGEVFDYYTDEDAVNVNLPMLHRQQQILLALLRAVIDTPDSGSILAQDDSALAEFLSAFCTRTHDSLPSGGILPDGYLLPSGEENHWVFDSSWLRSWIFDNIYTK